MTMKKKSTISCDICGKSSLNPTKFLRVSGAIAFPPVPGYFVDPVSDLLSLNEGTSYPLDLCKKCFKDVYLKPELKVSEAK